MRGVLVLVVLLTASDVFAQSSVPPGLNVGELPRAAVLDNRGVETRGRLLKIDNESVVLIVDGAERRFQISQLNRVTKRGDSLKNGAITGAIVGLGAGLLTAALGDCIGECRASQRFVGLVLSPAVYAAIGTGIDAANQGSTTLYQAPTVRSARANGAAFALRLTW